MKFPDLLALVGIAPKTLPQAKEALDNSAAALTDVAAMFAAAGLDLDAMRAAGPEALKAHIESIDNTEELAEALQENEKLTADLEAVNTQFKSIEGIATKLGLTAETAKTSEVINAKFEDFVSKQTTLALAKTGHPPAHVPAVTETTTAAKTDAELLTEYGTLKGADRQAFYALHEQALWRASQRASHAAA